MAAKRKKPRASAALREYARKRDFTRTAEPSGKTKPRGKRAGRSREPIFVVQKHAARALHYDFRLELDGVLKSWAVPKGPSLDPRVKRMAIQTEDHPLAYADFEGEIPKGEYGAGQVETWDRGHWEPIGDPRAGLEKGHVGFRLHGDRLRGEFLLTRMRPRPGDRGKTAWLLIKRRDTAARSPARGAAPLPTVELQLATLVKKPPVGPDWVHELKLDGYRILARVDAGEVALLTRNGIDRTRQMPAIAAALARLPLQSALIDGEAVALDASGVSRFARLQDALKSARADVQFYAFDLLFLDGEDLRDAPLIERKKRLRKLLSRLPASSLLHYCDHTDGSGAEFFGEACRIGAEGVISKRGDAPYRAGRGQSWLKSKCGARQEFVVVGFTPASGSRVGLGALLLGFYDDDGALHYCGKVGTGFSDAALSELRGTLAKRERAKPPVSDASSADRDARWVKPDLVAEVSFTEWTRDGKLRHPSFIALRTDKPATAVRAERAGDAVPEKTTKPEKIATKKTTTATKSAGRSDVAGVSLSSPDRVLFPDLGITKRELAEYCETMAERLLPGLVNRPLSLVRCPDGCGKPCFYQKHATESTPARVGRVQIEKGETPYTMVRNLGDVVALVQMSTIELHPWGARADQLERPDLLVMDLDPDPAVPWRRLADTAERVRAMLTELGLVAFLRGTGGKGLHVVAPLLRRSTWPELKAFAHAIALQLVKEAPDQYTAQISKAKRRGKILIDYLRNQRDATAIASYSVRARPGAPVAIPLDWSELEAKKGPPIWSLRDAPARLREPDPWQDFETSRRALTAKARKSVGGA
jgi:bifunctional non-homologous end joining protein LigD